MEIMGKVSKGSKMDQIYLSKNRTGFGIGEYVIIKPLGKEKTIENLYFYGVMPVNPIKVEIVKRIISIIDKAFDNYENLIITGSFLDNGFNFKDIDIILISEEKSNKRIENTIKEKLNLETHFIFINKEQFKEALKIDPSWTLMLKQCISAKRLAPLPAKRKLNYKYLDAQLIKSKTLMENFDYLTGEEKYKLLRNLIAIYLFIKNLPLSKESIEKEIRKKLDTEIEEIKNNLIDKNFLKKYKKLYIKLEKEIIKNASKQKEID